MVFLSSSDILSLIFSSSIVVFMLKQQLSRPFLAPILSFCFSSSALYFSASFTIRSISSLDRRPYLSPPSVLRQSLLQTCVAGGTRTSTCGSNQTTSSSSTHSAEGSPSTRTTLAVLSATLPGATARRWGSPATRWQ